MVGRDLKKIKIQYEYAPVEYSEEKLNEVYSMLFDEIKELIINENKYVKSKTN